MKTAVLALTSVMFTLAPASAQQTTGVPGSPSATTTIDGKYLPPPPAPFGGTINLDATDSKPYWPPTVVPRKGAPNILLIMTDDQGYGDMSCHGNPVLKTPNMDRLVAEGTAYTHCYTTSPVCVGARASLLPESLSSNGAVGYNSAVTPDGAAEGETV